MTDDTNLVEDVDEAAAAELRKEQDRQYQQAQLSKEQYDTMIENASVPNLASLLRGAKKAGHITSTFRYGSSSA